MRSLALDAEALGVDTLWVADEPGFWECWTILSALAEATTRVGIGPLVACTRYRSPTIFVTMVRALEEVSGGRVTLALGSGQGPKDKRWPALGFDGTRHVARFAEAVEIVVRLVRSESFSFEGEFYRLAEPNLGPAGPRPGGPPIWVAGGRQRTMEVAARWGDTVNVNRPLTDAASVAAVRESVAAATTAVGKDPAAVRLTGWTRIAPSADGRFDADRADTIAGTADAVAARLLEIHGAGVEHVTCFIGDPEDHHAYPALTPAALERFAPVLAAVRAA
jgi:alkanesulfonate monooxygenase SsuD/methylene tetrahydromethanopterin reductase-like flavin-dependent oxidoreductase (luciferase family)